MDQRGLRKTPIIDKNGVRTSRNKRVDGPKSTAAERRAVRDGSYGRPSHSTRSVKAIAGTTLGAILSLATLIMTVGLGVTGVLAVSTGLLTLTVEIAITVRYSTQIERQDSERPVSSLWMVLAIFFFIVFVALRSLT